MEKTTEDIKIETGIAKRILRCYEEPNPECRFEITCGNLDEFNELSNEQRERITWVRIEFVSDIQSCIMELKRFPNLRSVMFFCCYGSDEVGIGAYRGLAELSNLDTLIFHDSCVIDAENSITSKASFAENRPPKCFRWSGIFSPERLRCP